MLGTFLEVLLKHGARQSKGALNALGARREKPHAGQNEMLKNAQPILLATVDSLAASPGRCYHHRSHSTHRIFIHISIE